MKSVVGVLATIGLVAVGSYVLLKSDIQAQASCCNPPRLSPMQRDFRKVQQLTRQ